MQRAGVASLANTNATVAPAYASTAQPHSKPQSRNGHTKSARDFPWCTASFLGRRLQSKIVHREPYIAAGHGSAHLSRLQRIEVEQTMSNILTFGLLVVSLPAREENNLGSAKCADPWP